MEIEVSIGEVVDKLSILKIKKDKIKDEEKLANIMKEYNYLKDKLGDIVHEEYIFKLYLLNLELWEIEDEIRDLERKKDFHLRFLHIARSIYRLNDKRAALKKQINLKYGSNFVEEKSYSAY